jgi:type IV secretory pathway VirB2 component (pilin)
MRMPRRITRSIAAAAFGLAALTGITTQATAAAAAEPSIDLVQPTTTISDTLTSISDTLTKGPVTARTKEERTYAARTKEE